MAIKITRYVRITSGVIGAQTVAQRALTGRRFSTDPRIPFGVVLSMGPGDAETYFGTSSAEAVFARQYFSYVSPAPISQAQELQFAAYAPTGRGATVFGAKPIGTLAQLQAITAGTLDININGTSNVSGAINLSTSTSLTDAVNKINTALALVPAFAGITLAYDALKGTYTLNRSAIAASTMTVNTTALAGLLGLNGSGVINSNGVAAQTPLDAFKLAEDVTDSFGSASFGVDMTVPNALELATYVAGQNVKYQLYIPVTKSNYSDFSAALLSVASVGLILNATAGQYKEALPAAAMAATNYNRRDASINFMFRSAAFTGDVSTDAEATLLDNARVNYYGTTATAGSNISFFQRGYLMGSGSAITTMETHANEQWLKAFLTARFMSALLNIGKIPANDEGASIILAQLTEAITLARENGTISIGTNLTATQISTVTQISGDPQAFRKIQSAGYWTGVKITQNTPASGITEYVAEYTLIYKKMDAIRTVVGSHNLV